MIANMIQNMEDTTQPANIRTNYRNSLDAIRGEIELAIRAFDLDQMKPLEGKKH